MDAAGNIKIVFGEGTTVSVGGFLLLERGEDAVPAVRADKVYTGGLSNAGGVLAIVDGACGASDVLDASAGWPAGNNGTKQTLERDTDGIGWHTSAAPGGTPRAENSIAAVPSANTASSTSAAGTNNAITYSAATNAATTNAATTSATNTTDTATIVVASSTAQACAATTVTASTTTTSTDAIATSTTVSAGSHLLIMEVQIAGVSSANDFVKIFNPGADTVDVSGWKLRKKSKTGTDYSLRTFPDGSAVAANGSFTWANAEDGFGDSLHANVTSTATLAADNSVALLDAAGDVVDAVAWARGRTNTLKRRHTQTQKQVKSL